MKLFGLMKKGKEENAECGEVPAELINDLVSKEFSEADIIKTLRESGYSFKNIDVALNNAIKNNVGGGSESPMQEEELFGEDLTEPPEPEPLPELEAIEQVYPEEEYSREVLTDEEVEEIVESIVEERLVELKGAIENLQNRLNNLSNEMGKLNLSLKKSDQQRVNEINAVRKDIMEIKTELSEINPRVAGLEKAFKDIVPPLVDNVRKIVVSKELPEPGTELVKIPGIPKELRETEQIPGAKEKTKILEETEEGKGLIL